jgi:hypothetical protein
MRPWRLARTVIVAQSAALSPACHSGHAARAGGSRAAAAGTRCGAGNAGWLNPAARSLALIRHRWEARWAMPAGHHVAVALPPGGSERPGARRRERTERGRLHGARQLLGGRALPALLARRNRVQRDPALERRRMVPGDRAEPRRDRVRSHQPAVRRPLHYRQQLLGCRVVYGQRGPAGPGAALERHHLDPGQHPNPGGTTTDGDENALLGIGCTSASNCWAVGFFATPPSFLGEALHWNGSAWSTG